MAKVRRSVKQKVVAAAAVAALLAGGSIAAVSATGQSNPRRHAHAHRHAARARDLAAAAGYLGISPAQLAGELAEGKSLAQIADATSGKSAAGLTEALVAARKARLATVAAKLPTRIAAEVNRAGGPIAGPRHARSSAARIAALFATPSRVGSVAASYLGLSASQLKAELGSAKTLAQVADATPGKSQAGLTAALLQARGARLARAAAAGRLSPARRAKRQARLPKRIDALVQRQFAGAH
ncbi:MAG TPA: hypothetical protein VHT25_11220 [Solirubrobacteraceae bacterium]|jgi:hypothetical protein|nr:hypothetical protein [Solirubrobacteraceae bacterium]